jgi:hypothetical protein
MPLCADHGLRIHPSSPTFVYYNGTDRPAKRTASRRNIRFETDFFAHHILDNREKAETHRFASENSEDALTWNVLVGIRERGQLHTLYEWFTGEPAAPNRIELYLWGLRIDPPNSEPQVYPPLKTVREILEPDIRRFKTEPDVILVGPSRLVCVEVKFTSGNPLARDEDAKKGDKPKRREDLIAKYVGRNQDGSKPLFRPEDVVAKVPSQLLRVSVFAARMAECAGLDWLAANLVTSTQWDRHHSRRGKPHPGFSDPTMQMPPGIRERFRFKTWEDLYAQVLRDSPALTRVADYMRGKSAFLKPAFRLT